MNATGEVVGAGDDVFCAGTVACSFCGAKYERALSNSGRCRVDDANVGTFDGFRGSTSGLSSC
jgi:hypothetical protein